MAAPLTSGRRARPGSSPRATTAGLLISLALALLVAAPVAATHTHGTLDCGSAGVFETEPASEIDPLPFEAPSPTSLLFLLEDTNQVFKAYTAITPMGSILGASNRPGLIWCTLSSTGPFFSSPWQLEGVLIP
jgi:hypothetical protein